MTERRFTDAELLRALSPEDMAEIRDDIAECEALNRLCDAHMAAEAARAEAEQAEREARKGAA